MTEETDLFEKELYLSLKQKYEGVPLKTVVKKYVPGTLVERNRWLYKELKQKYPLVDNFYEDYHQGGYLNTDYTVYYDQDGNKLHAVNHGNYS